MGIKFHVTCKPSMIKLWAKRILYQKLHRPDGNNSAKNILTQVINDERTLIQLSIAKKDGEIVGWAFVFFGEGITGWKNAAMVFTDKHFRRQGIGTKCLEIARYLRVVVWHESAPEFFNKQKHLI